MSDPYERDVELANEAEAFLASPLGRRITQLAGQEIDRCTLALKTVAPEDVGEIRNLQETIRRNETLGAWIAEILHLGLEAKQVLAEEEN